MMKSGGGTLWRPIDVFAHRKLLAAAFLVLSAGLADADGPAKGLDPFPDALSQTMTQARPNSLKPAGRPLPGSVDLSPFLPPVQNQGPIGSCAAWSTVYYARTLLEQKERHWGAEDKSHEFSPLYSYNQITKGQNEGTAIEDHMGILKDQGIVSLADFPYVDQLDVQPNSELRTKASALKIDGFKAIPRTKGSVDLIAVKSFLAQGLPVIGGFDLFDDFDQFRGGIYQTTSGNSEGGHAMAIVGYDDQRQALRIVNSWGPEWGDGGFAWISYDSVLAMTKNNYGFAVMFKTPTASSVPLAPQDLVASKGEFEGAIKLTWTAQPDCRYAVLRADNNTQDWKPLATVSAGSYTDGALPPGVTYVYAVRAEGGSTDAPTQSDLSPVAEGWTPKKAEVPGIVQGLTSMRYQNSVILLWPPLANADVYRVFRYDSTSEQFVLLGTSSQPVFRDDSGFGNQNSATYFVQAGNAQGDGFPSDHLQVYQPVTPAVIEAPVPPQLAKKLAGQKIAPAPQKKAYQGPYYQADWFDPATMRREFADYAAREKKAFEDWKRQDQADFDQFLKNDSMAAPR